MPSGAIHKKNGILYVVSTPIGNLEDITLRALRILKEVDIIAAENISRTKILLSHYNIKKKIISFRRENQNYMTKKITEKLNAGYNIALVSDAGTPAISDPGSYLVSKAMENHIKVIPIPGVSAITAAMSVSGMSHHGFVFFGFLPSTQKKRKKRLNSLKPVTLPVILFESPHRLLETLNDIKEILGNRDIILLKEMTKLHEEIIKGSIDDILKKFQQTDIKGEYVIILSAEKEYSLDKINDKLIFLIDTMIKNGLSTKDIAKNISEKEKISYRKAYKICIERKKLIHGTKEKAQNKK